MHRRYCCFLGLLIGLSPLFLRAQDVRPHYLEGGVGYSLFALQAEFRYTLYYNGASRVGTLIQTPRPSASAHIHLGTHWEWKDRWHLKGHLGYSQAKTIDDPNGRTQQLPIPDYTRISTASPRSYRIGWLEALILYAPRHGYRWEWQAGTGLSYGLWWQQYRSGFEYDLDLDIYRVERTTTAWSSSLGLPLHLQLQYFIDRHFKFGLSAQTNLFFSGDTQAGIQAFLAYRLR